MKDKSWQVVCGILALCVGLGLARSWWDARKPADPPTVPTPIGVPFDAAHAGSRPAGPDDPVADEEIRTVMAYSGPGSATEAAAVLVARRMMDIEELRAGRGSAPARQVLAAAMSRLRQQQPQLADAEARATALKWMEMHAANFDDPNDTVTRQELQRLMQNLRVTSEGEARALIRTRRRLALGPPPSPAGSPVQVPGNLPLPAHQHAQPDTDEALARLLVGAWRYTTPDGVSTTISFEAGGGWSMYVSSTNPLVNLPATVAGEVSGLWAVRNSELGMECRKANGALIAAFTVGKAVRSPVGVIDWNTVRLTGVEGDRATRTYQRVR